MYINSRLINYKRNINQLINRVVELIKKQKRKFVYIMRSDGHRISFIKFYENGTMIRSCDCNLFGGDNNLGDGFYFLVGLLCTKPELLGYQPLFHDPIPAAVLQELGCEAGVNHHLYTGKFSQIFAVDSNSKILKCYDLTLHRNHFDSEVAVHKLCKGQCEALAQIIKDHTFENVGYLLKIPYASSTLEFEEYSFETFRLVVQSVLSAFKFLHSKNILHGDVSPSNILLYKENTTCKCILNDYGLSREIGDTTVFDAFFGTIAYCSHRWYKCILKDPIKAHFILDYENLFYVLLWFAARSREIHIDYQHFPWDKLCEESEALQIKFSLFNTQCAMKQVIQTLVHKRCSNFLVKFYNCFCGDDDEAITLITALVEKDLGTI